MRHPFPFPEFTAIWYTTDVEKLATDIYSFEKLRKNGFTYVDKTAQILSLANM